MKTQLETLQDLLKARVAELGSAASVSREVEALGGGELSERTVGKYIHGGIPRTIRSRTIALLQKYMDAVTGGMSQEREMEEVATEENGFIKVQYLDVLASAGPAGFENEHPSTKSHIAFQSGWVLSRARPHNLFAITAMGESMEPTIPDRAVVLIDKSKTEPSARRVSLVSHNGMQKLKRVQMVDGRYTLFSDNPNYPPEEVAPEDHFLIMGQVLWVGYEL